MIYTIEFFRERIGLASADASQDDDINAALSAAYGYAEIYCDRKFEWSADTEIFTHFYGDTISLRRYPITQINSIDGTELSYHYSVQDGLLYFDGVARSHEITIDYEGGYHESADSMHPYVWPDALAFALLGIFDNVWSQMQAGATFVTGGIVKNVNAAGISISYESSGASYAAFGGLIPPQSAAYLDLIVREKA